LEVLEISQLLKDVAMDLGFTMALKQGHKLVLISMIYRCSPYETQVYFGRIIK